MGTKEIIKQEHGKGGNFATRKNPFGGEVKRTGGAPDLASGIALAQAIDATLKAGCAVMLGHTRDGGALVITVLDGEDRHRTYCSDEDELDAAITALQTMYA